MSGVRSPTIKIALLLIAASTLIAYGQALRNGFVWDDYLVVVGNDFVKSWKNLPQLLGRGYLSDISQIRSGSPGGSAETTYRPLLTLTYFLDYSLWGLKPFGYHLTNIILHTSCGILLYLLALMLGLNNRGALLAGLLFVLHPVNSEAVSVVSFREEPLSFLFVALAFILYLKMLVARRRRPLFYCASLSAFLLALCSKEMAITLPPLLALHDYVFGRTQGWRQLLRLRWRLYAGYAAVAALYLASWTAIKGDLSEYIREYPYPGGSLYTSLLTISRVVTAYLGWLVFPVSVHPTLAESTPTLLARSFWSTPVILSFLINALCLALACRLYRRRPIASFAIFWIFIALIPAYNLFPIANIMAARYLYIPSAGFCLFAAWFLSSLQDTQPRLLSKESLRRLGLDATVIILVFFAGFTFLGTLTWKNNHRLWHVLAGHYPDNPVAHLQLGHALRQEGLSAQAIEEYRRALGLGGPVQEIYDGLGQAYAGMGQLDEAIGYFRAALSLGPGYCQAANNLGVALAQQGKFAEAKEIWSRLRQTHPWYRPAEVNLDKLGLLQGD